MSQLSPVLNILERVDRLANAPRQASKAESLPYGSDMERGLHPPSSPSPHLPFTIDLNSAVLKLDDISEMIIQLRTWLQANPLFLSILDESIRQEVQAMERRTNRMGIVVNALFTFVGTGIGVFLPPLISIVSHWLG